MLDGPCLIDKLLAAISQAANIGLDQWCHVGPCCGSRAAGLGAAAARRCAAWSRHFLPLQVASCRHSRPAAAYASAQLAVSLQTAKQLCLALTLCVPLYACHNLVTLAHNASDRRLQRAQLGAFKAGTPLSGSDCHGGAVHIITHAWSFISVWLNEWAEAGTLQHAHPPADAVM